MSSNDDSFGMDLDSYGIPNVQVISVSQEELVRLSNQSDNIDNNNNNNNNDDGKGGNNNNNNESNNNNNEYGILSVKLQGNKHSVHVHIHDDATKLTEKIALSYDLNKDHRQVLESGLLKAQVKLCQELLMGRRKSVSSYAEENKRLKALYEDVSKRYDKVAVDLNTVNLNVDVTVRNMYDAFAAMVERNAGQLPDHLYNSNDISTGDTQLDKATLNLKTILWRHEKKMDTIVEEKEKAFKQVETLSHELHKFENQLRKQQHHNHRHEHEDDFKSIERYEQELQEVTTKMNGLQEIIDSNDEYEKLFELESVIEKLKMEIHEYEAAYTHLEQSHLQLTEDYSKREELVFNMEKNHSDLMRDIEEKSMSINNAKAREERHASEMKNLTNKCLSMEAEKVQEIHNKDEEILSKNRSIEQAFFEIDTLKRNLKLETDKLTKANKDLKAAQIKINKSASMSMIDIHDEAQNDDKHGNTELTRMILEQEERIMELQKKIAEDSSSSSTTNNNNNNNNILEDTLAAFDKEDKKKNQEEHTSPTTKKNIFKTSSIDDNDPTFIDNVNLMEETSASSSKKNNNNELSLKLKVENRALKTSLKVAEEKLKDLEDLTGNGNNLISATDIFQERQVNNLKGEINSLKCDKKDLQSELIKVANRVCELEEVNEKLQHGQSLNKIVKIKAQETDNLVVDDTIDLDLDLDLDLHVEEQKELKGKSDNIIEFKETNLRIKEIETSMKQAKRRLTQVAVNKIAQLSEVLDNTEKRIEKIDHISNTNDNSIDIIENNINSNNNNYSNDSTDSVISVSSQEKDRLESENNQLKKKIKQAAKELDDLHSIMDDVLNRASFMGKNFTALEDNLQNHICNVNKVDIPKENRHSIKNSSTNHYEHETDIDSYTHEYNSYEFSSPSKSQSEFDSNLSSNNHHNKNPNHNIVMENSLDHDDDDYTKSIEKEQMKSETMNSLRRLFFHFTSYDNCNGESVLTLSQFRKLVREINLYNISSALNPGHIDVIFSLCTRPLKPKKRKQNSKIVIQMDYDDFHDEKIKKNYKGPLRREVKNMGFPQFQEACKTMSLKVYKDIIEKQLGNLNYLSEDYQVIAADAALEVLVREKVLPYVRRKGLVPKVSSQLSMVAEELMSIEVVRLFEQEKPALATIYNYYTQSERSKLYSNGEKPGHLLSFKEMHRMLTEFEVTPKLLSISTVFHTFRQILIRDLHRGYVYSPNGGALQKPVEDHITYNQFLELLGNIAMSSFSCLHYFTPSDKMLALFRWLDQSDGKSKLCVKKRSFGYLRFGARTSYK